MFYSFADPFFIACVLDSDYPDKDLTTVTGIIDVVTYEISNRESDMSKTWMEYLQLTLVNDRHAKSLLQFFNKSPEQVSAWSPNLQIWAPSWRPNLQIWEHGGG